MTLHSSSRAQRTSCAPPGSHAAHRSDYAGYDHSSNTPPPLGQRAPSIVPAHIRAPKLRVPPAGYNFPYSSPSPSPFVPAPWQLSPSEQRKRAISFGPKPATSSTQRPSVPSGFRSGTIPRPQVVPSNSSSNPQSTHPLYVAGDVSKTHSHATYRTEAVTSNSRSNFQSTHPPYVTVDDTRARAARGHSNTSTTRGSSPHDYLDPQRSTIQWASTADAHKAPRRSRSVSSTAQISRSSDSREIQRSDFWSTRGTQQSLSQSEKYPMLKNFPLLAAVAAANADHREFLWYGVWNIAIKDHIFYQCDTDTTACTLVPRYVLQREYDPSSSDSSPIANCKNKLEWVIPDFALVLQHIRLTSHGSAMITRQRVILIVEDKPKRVKRFRRAFPNPFAFIEDQTRRQALFAFASDPTLNTVGIITTFGDVWQYGEMERPASPLLGSWSEAKDPTWGIVDVTQSAIVPTFLKGLSGRVSSSFDLMDSSGKSTVAFKFIADRIKERESDFWSQPPPPPTGCGS